MEHRRQCLEVPLLLWSVFSPSFPISGRVSPGKGGQDLAHYLRYPGDFWLTLPMTVAGSLPGTSFGTFSLPAEALAFPLAACSCFQLFHSQLSSIFP